MLYVECCRILFWWFHEDACWLLLEIHWFVTVMCGLVESWCYMLIDTIAVVYFVWLHDDECYCYAVELCYFPAKTEIPHALCWLWLVMFAWTCMFMVLGCRCLIMVWLLCCMLLLVDFVLLIGLKKRCLAIVETLGFVLPSNLIFDWLLLLCVLLHWGPTNQVISFGPPKHSRLD